jgi:hypothetical protein
VPPAASISFESVASKGARRATTATCAPSEASSFATSRPMPTLHPVTTATLSLTSRSMSFPPGLVYTDLSRPAYNRPARNELLHSDGE